MEIRNISFFIFVIPLISGFLNIAQTGVRTIEIEPTPPNTIITSKPVTEAYETVSVEVYDWDTAQIVQLPPILQKIAECESNDTHFDETGEVVKNYNTNGTTDYGRYQINSIHIPRIESMGLNILNEADNIKFALILYEEQGVQPWYASSFCHGL